MSMTKTTSVAAALIMLAPAAFAGGYVAPVVPTPVDIPVAQPAPWAGAYGGLGLGYTFGGDDVVGISDPTDTVIASPDSVDIKGVNGSLHLGYRWQTAMRGRQVVIGPELSYEKSNADASFNTNGVEASSEMDNFIALRVKTGVVTSSGNSLIYGIAGIGRGDFNYAVSGAGMDYDGSFKDNAWILGLGAERRVSDRMSIFGEWEFRGFGKTKLSDDGDYSTRATPEHHNVKLGVNFRF